MLFLPIVFGLFLLNEIQYYTERELTFLSVGVIVCLIGVRLIMKKAQLTEKSTQQMHKFKINPQDDYMNAMESELSVSSLLNELRTIRIDDSEDYPEPVDKLPHFSDHKSELLLSK